MKFLYDAPALMHKGAIIVGDTHFGMEEKLRRRGIYDENFSERLYGKLKSLVLEHKASQVIFLGDVKEEVTMLDRRTADVLSKLSMLCKVTVVRGNHDGGIEARGALEVAPAEGIVYEGLGLVHGHSWPGDALVQCEYLVMGHQHPMIAIEDAFGRTHREPAWFIAPCNPEGMAQRYGKFNMDIRLVLMPAFNPLVGSTLNYDEKEHLGPILNNKLFKLDDAIVFRLDGTCLGKFGNI
ncbi:MAG TPA: metallophosphoesterase family protein [Candidatus Bilamarchaeum sp.]|nr:metallophosphoesterase family protein [Candidatus Bilamarchaeum sp.]